MYIDGSKYFLYLSVVGKVPMALVWIRTLHDSIGERAISAKNSAEAEAAK